MSGYGHVIRPALRRAVVVAAVFAGLVVGVLAPTPAHADENGSASDLVPSSGAYFGSILEWSSDSVASQADRLGAPAALYQHAFDYPLTDVDETSLAQFLQQTAGAGAIPVVNLRPRVPLDQLDTETAENLVDVLDGLAADAPGGFYLGFGPDMNASWVGWGQQPAAYREAYATLSRVVHERLPSVAMLWSPFWGGDYPFAAARTAVDALAEADTDGDGMLTPGDDPYAPYYPGDRFVDAVGLALYHDDTAGGEPVNTAPAPTEFVDRLSAPTPGGGDFVSTYAGPDRPLLIETASFYSPSVQGASELDVKATWWRQIEDAIASGRFPELAAVVWRDTVTTRGAVGESVIDWSVTLAPSPVRAAFLADLADSELQLGPVREAVSGAADVAGGGAVSLGGLVGWVVAGGILCAVGVLVVLALRRRLPASWGYRGPPSRDERIDLLRGLAIVFVVVNHVGIVSLLQDVTQEWIGIVSGAELFVLLSGVVLGMVYRPKLVSGGIGEVVIRTGQRAWKLYRTALAVVVLIFFLAMIPFLQGSAVTTFTDAGTGAGGAASAGRVYDLYPGAAGLLQYPVDPQSVLQFLLLRVGPWQINVLGLYVLLLLVSPLVLWALGRRWWPWVVGISLAIYGMGTAARLAVVPAQFEDSFPLLVWQVLFVVGMTAGFYRRELVQWFSGRAGRVVLVATIGIATVFMLLSWNNPFVPSPIDARLAIIPENVFREVYAALFERTFLEPGRLLNVIAVAIALYALLTAYWRPIARVLGWFLIPLGQATLYVFVMHVFFALIAASIPVLREGNVWIGTAANLVILALLWVMVKTRFLFRIVPR